MTLPPWSYSLLSDFANCRRKAYHKFIARDLPREEPSEAQLYGQKVHKDFENYISGKKANIEPKWQETFLAPIMPLRPNAEVKFGMTEDGGPAKFFESPWGRGVVDALILRGSAPGGAPIEACIIDWKTGKVREDPRELQLHALLLKSNLPSLEKITGAYAWLAETRLGTIYDLSNTERAYHAARASMLEMQKCADADHWPANPNALCSWCPVKQCEFNRSGE